MTSLEPPPRAWYYQLANLLVDLARHNLFSAVPAFQRVHPLKLTLRNFGAELGGAVRSYAALGDAKFPSTVHHSWPPSPLQPSLLSP